MTACVATALGQEPAPPLAPSAESAEPSPVEVPAALPLALPSDWEARDLEGRWLWMVQDLKDNASDGQRRQKWATKLGELEDFDLLEMVGIYKGWAYVGPELARRNAPQWIRVAVWNLHSYSSHNKENARDVLTNRMGEAVSWFRAHPLAQRGEAATFFEDLERTFNSPVSVEVDALPPLDPRQVLMAYLDAPAELPVFGDRLAAEPGVRYLHQVVRALGGIHVRGRLEPMDVAKVVRLAAHDTSSLRVAAFESLCRLPPSLVPWKPMLETARDDGAGVSQRGWAVMVLSYSNHPQARFALGRIVLEPSQPGASHAIHRFPAMGGPHELDVLRQLAAAGDPSPDVAHGIQSLEKQLNSELGDADFDRVFSILVTAAWAKREAGEEGLEAWQAVDKWLQTMDASTALGWIRSCQDDVERFESRGVTGAEQVGLRATLGAWAASYRASGK